MKLTRNSLSFQNARVSRQHLPCRPRLAGRAGFAKWNPWALAAAFLLSSPASRAADIEGAWHLGPQPAVRAVCHAGDTLWVGTAAGLFLLDIRDGSLIERIEAGDRLPASSVRGIAATGDSVFVATDGGLALFRGGEVAVFTPRDPGALRGIALNRLYGVEIGLRGEVLVPTLGYGAGLISADSLHMITREDSLLDDIVFDVKDSPRGRRYFATNAGLCAQLEDSTFAWYQAGTGLPRGETRQLAVAPDGAIYVLVSRLGIFRFDNARALRLPPPNGIALRDAHCLSMGPDGALWAAGNGWVVVRRGSQWKRVDDGRSGTSWTTVMADGAGAFAGTAGGMVVSMSRGSDMVVDLGGGLPAPRVGAIAPDGKGGAWFVSGGHLVYADVASRRVVVDDGPADARAVTIAAGGEVITAGRWTVRERRASGWIDLHPDVVEADPSFTAARVDDDGALWVGTRSGAIYRYDGELWLRMARGSEALDGRGILDVRSAPRGTWAIGAGVPVRCVDGGVERFAGIDSSETVVALDRTPAGQWVAATARRLFVFDDAANVWRATGVLTLVGGSGNGELEGEITAIAFDRTGRFFIGSTRGLGVAGPSGVRWLHPDDGILGGAVATLAVDGTHLWVGFEQDGLSILPLEALR